VDVNFIVTTKTVTGRQSKNKTWKSRV